MADAQRTKIAPATGKLGVLIPGLGAVGTTFIAGVKAIIQGHGKPIGSVTQMGTIRLGKRTEKRSPLVKDFVPLSELSDLEFGAWDIFEDNCYQVASNADVIFKPTLEKIKSDLEPIKPWAAAFDSAYVKNLDGSFVKKAASKWELAEQVGEDIDRFKKEKNLDRMVMVWCGSTEAFTAREAVHESVAAFEKGLKESHPAISPSMIYAYAAIKRGIPYANGAPNLTVDIPAMNELAKEYSVPIAGKDFKTGQTLMKTVMAPGFKARLLGVNGWFSSNILGNRDGEVLDDPASFKTKEESKLSVLEQILEKDKYPDLYGDLYHKVRINYYPPRGDDKESWDNIDLVGWLGYKMQMKLNFLCKDSILAAPIVLDLVLLLDFAKRAGMRGIQEWLSFYFKSPMVADFLYPEHDIFVQQTKMKNTLRHLMGEEVITHLGLDYYE